MSWNAFETVRQNWSVILLPRQPGMNEWYIRTQNLAMDLEWATLNRRDGKPPAAVYRARATARAAEASALIPPRAE